MFTQNCCFPISMFFHQGSVTNYVGELEREATEWKRTETQWEELFFCISPLCILFEWQLMGLAWQPTNAASEIEKKKNAFATRAQRRRENKMQETKLKYSHAYRLSQRRWWKVIKNRFIYISAFNKPVCRNLLCSTTGRGRRLWSANTRETLKMRGKEKAPKYMKLKNKHRPESA